MCALPPAQLLLGKFWGLMHEADRPWQREVVLHLCCTLPPEARRRYRALRPSTMQQLLSRRAQVRGMAIRAHMPCKRVARVICFSKLAGSSPGLTWQGPCQENPVPLCDAGREGDTRGGGAHALAAAQGAALAAAGVLRQGRTHASSRAAAQRLRSFLALRSLRAHVQAGGSRGARSGSRSRSSGGSSSPPDSSDLEGAREQVVTLRANLGRTRANLQALASQAQGPLKDSDYGAYCRNTLDPVLQQLLDAGRQVERGVRSLGRGWSEGYAQPPMARGSGFRGGGAGLMGSRSADGYRTQSRWQQQEYEEQGEQEGWYGDADSGPAEDWGEEDEEHLQWAPQRTRVSGRLQGLLGTWGFEDLGSYSGLGWRYPPWPHVVVRRMGAPRIFLSARPPDEPVQVAGSLQQQQEEDDQW